MCVETAMFSYNGVPTKQITFDFMIDSNLFIDSRLSISQLVTELGFLLVVAWGLGYMNHGKVYTV